MEALEVGAESRRPLADLVRRIWQDYSILVVFVAIVAACGLVTRGRFLELGNVSAVLTNASVVGIIALGMTFVIIGGGIDLSSGPVLATSAAALVQLMRMTGADGTPLVPMPVAVLACIAVAVIFGYANGMLITKAMLPPFIVTLAVGIIARSLVMYFCRGATISVERFSSVLGFGRLYFIPYPFLILLVLAIAFHVLLTRTKFGSYVFAVGGNENAARYSGIKVDRIRIATYMLVGFCTGIGAIIEVSRMQAVAAATQGFLYEFEAIIAVVAGGTSLAGGRGRMVGTVVGCVILGIVSNMMIMMDISPYLRDAVKGSIILFAVLLQRRER